MRQYTIGLTPRAEVSLECDDIFLDVDWMILITLPELSSICIAYCSLTCVFNFCRKISYE